MTVQFKPILLSFEERLAPTAFALSASLKTVTSVNIGVILPGDPVSPPPVSPPPTSPPPAPPSPGGM